MKKQLCANLWLLLLTVGAVCIIYPTLMWSFANVFFPANAAGSMILEKSGDKEIVRGSSLIAQKFTKEWYFQPRPSAAAYNATASGASNWGASNPKLRDRVARQLGPIVKYHPDSEKWNVSVQKDIEAWFVGYVPAKDQPSLIVKWAKDYPTLASAWIKDDANKTAAVEWLRIHPSILEDWQKAKREDLQKAGSEGTPPEVDLNNPDSVPFDDIAVAFFESIDATPEYKNRWPAPEEVETGEKDQKGEPIKIKRFKPVSEGEDIQSTFFDMWLQAHPAADLKRVPADMVMASGSGLDPHISLRNAQYQIDRVVEKRTKNMKRDAATVRAKIEAIVQTHSFTPLSGLIGEPLVNVLELNLQLDKELPMPQDSAKSP